MSIKDVRDMRGCNKQRSLNMGDSDIMSQEQRQISLIIRQEYMLRSAGRAGDLQSAIL